MERKGKNVLENETKKLFYIINMALSTIFDKAIILQIVIRLLKSFQLENIEVIFIFITNNLKNEQAIVHSISMG
jgi:hypothetical protein